MITSCFQICSECNKVFALKDGLIRHIETHSNNQNIVSTAQPPRIREVLSSNSKIFTFQWFLVANKPNYALKESCNFSLRSKRASYAFCTFVRKCVVKVREWYKCKNTNFGRLHIFLQISLKFLNYLKFY